MWRLPLNRRRKPLVIEPYIRGKIKIVVITESPWERVEGRNVMHYG